MICVTNRKLCQGDFLDKIEQITQGQHKPDVIILREKDLDEAEYEKLAKRVKEICVKNKQRLVINSFINVARNICVKEIQLSVDLLRQNIGSLAEFEKVWVSVHSVEEAVWAEKNGADYLIAGHIFETDCKKGLKPRGLDFLEKVCKSVDIPVFAIGGIDEQREKTVISLGARGGCMMSGYMRGK